MPAVQTDDGVSISYTIRGDGAQSLLFMHGWGGSSGYFDETLTHLDLAGVRAIAFDLRGHGDSDKVESGYTLDRLAKDALAVADHAKAKRVVAIGFSMSGKFVQYLPVVAPDRVAGQILVAPCPASALPFPADVQRDWVSRAGNWDRLREVTAMFITRPVAPSVLDRWADGAVRVPRIALDETLNVLTQTSFVERLKTVTAPTLVVGGVHDPILTPQVLRETVVVPLPKARFVLLDCNHEIPIEQPRELAGLISAFLAGTQ